MGDQRGLQTRHQEDQREIQRLKQELRHKVKALLGGSLLSVLVLPAVALAIKR